MIERSTLAEVRNPLLGLPTFRALTMLDDPARSLIRQLLLDLHADARLRAAECWRRRKPPMAAYWAAVAVYAGHAARAFRPTTRRRGEGGVVRSDGMSVDSQPSGDRS